MLIRNPLLDALMRPGSVEIVYLRAQHTVELLLMQDKQVIEAFTSHRPQQPFTDSIRAWGVIRSFENLNVTHFRHTREARPKLAIIITDEVLRSLTKSSGFPKRYERSKRRSEIVSHQCGSLCESPVQS